MTRYWAMVDRWRFSLLLGLLLGAFFLEPFVRSTPVGGGVQIAIYAAIFASVVRLANQSDLSRLPGYAMIAVWALVTVAAENIGGPVVSTLAIVITIALVAWITGCTVRLLLIERKADGDALAGAVFGYFLLALLWALLYTTLQLHTPGAIAIPEGSQLQTEMLYFSIVTLTTLGYGDILPTTALSKIMAGIEAAIGTLYLAILIGRIVGVFRPSSRERAIDE